MGILNIQHRAHAAWQPQATRTLLWACVALSLAVRAQAQPQVAGEYDVKAAFLAGFTQYTTWPPSPLTTNELKDLAALAATLTASEFSVADVQAPRTMATKLAATLFSGADLRSAATLAASLKMPTNEVARYMMNRLRDVTRTNLAEWKQPDEPSLRLQEALIEDLQAIISGPSIWEKSRFAEIALRPETSDLVRQRRNGEPSVRLNWLLLEDAFPVALRRNRALADPAFAATLYLAERLQPSTRTSLLQWPRDTEPPTALLQALIRDFNSILAGAPLWEQNRFAGVTLRKATQEWVKRAPAGDDVCRLNRLLLEDVFAQELSANPAVADPAFPVSRAIAGRLRETTRRSLLEWRTPDALSFSVAQALVDDLNSIVVSPLPLWDKDRFATVALRSETLELTKRNASGVELVRLHRLLLEDAYPQGLAKAATDRPIIIGVLGSDPFGPVLDQTIRAQKGTRSLEVRRVASLQQARECQVVFIGKSNARYEADWLDGLKDQPILTVGESGETIGRGGVVEFVVKNNRVRFEVSWPAMQKAGLKISALMLNSASKVHGAPDLNP